MNNLIAKGKAFFVKNAPELLLYLGLAAGVAAIVTAIQETQEALDIVEEHIEVKQILQDAAESKQFEDEEGNLYEYDDELLKKDSATLMLKTTGRLVKVYAPTVGLAALSITCILSSHGMLKSRNVALTAAYNVLDKSFKKYRESVRDKYGDKVDEDFFLGRVTEKIETTELDAKGKEKKVTKEVTTYNKTNSDSFDRCFDEFNCPHVWKKDPQYNLSTIKIQLENANRYLRANKHVFLNEVYDLFGFERTPEGQVVGWVWDGNPHKIDFGIYDDRAETIDFLNGLEPSIWLHFNVDGVIIDKI